MTDLIFRWEPPVYQSARSCQICDISGHRLLVRRRTKSSREFYAAIDGKQIGALHPSIESAKLALEDHIKMFGGSQRAVVETLAPSARARCPTCGFPVKSIFDHVDRDGIDPATGQCK